MFFRWKPKPGLPGDRAAGSDPLRGEPPDAARGCNGGVPGGTAAQVGRLVRANYGNGCRCGCTAGVIVAALPGRRGSTAYEVKCDNCGTTYTLEMVDISAIL